MLGSERPEVVVFQVAVDPTADAKKFPVMRAPRDITVTKCSVVTEQTQNAGTATTWQLEVWDAGTVVAGTVGAAVGGTASGARLTSHTPAEMTISSTYSYVSEGDWLYIGYGEEGAGWISGDRTVVAIEYLIGKAQ